MKKAKKIPGFFARFCSAKITLFRKFLNWHDWLTSLAHPVIPLLQCKSSKPQVVAQYGLPRCRSAIVQESQVPGCAGKPAQGRLQVFKYSGGEKDKVGKGKRSSDLYLRIDPED